MNDILYTSTRSNNEKITSAQARLALVLNLQEMGQQQPSAGGANPRDAFQRETGVAFFLQFLPVLASKTMGFILDGCQKPQQEKLALGYKRILSR